jgi:hypothetical protein
MSYTIAKMALFIVRFQKKKNKYQFRTQKNLRKTQITIFAGAILTRSIQPCGKIFQWVEFVSCD